VGKHAAPAALPLSGEGAACRKADRLHGVSGVVLEYTINTECASVNELSKGEPMAAQRFEYKVVYFDFRGRISVEGDETLIQDGERMTAFGRRVLNNLGGQGWELVGIQHQPMGAAFHIFKRLLAEGQEPEPAKPIKTETTPL
jgi:hypothetical protein